MTPGGHLKSSEQAEALVFDAIAALNSDDRAVSVPADRGVSLDPDVGPMDSLDVIDLMTAIEVRLRAETASDVTFPGDAGSEGLTTIGDVIDSVAQQLESSG